MYHYQSVAQFFADIVIIRMMNNDEIVLIICPFHSIFSCLFCLNFLFKFEYSTRMAYIHFLASNKIRTIEFFVWESTNSWHIWDPFTSMIFSEHKFTQVYYLVDPEFIHHMIVYDSLKWCELSVALLLYINVLDG